VLHDNASRSTAQDDTAVNAALDEFWRAIKLDLYGTFLGYRFGIPELIKAGGGSVINMSSNVALMGVAARDCYTAAKGGVAADLSKGRRIPPGRPEPRRGRVLLCKLIVKTCPQITVNGPVSASSILDDAATPFFTNRRCGAALPVRSTPYPRRQALPVARARG